MEQNQNTNRDYSLEYNRSSKKYDFIVNLFQAGRDNAHRTKALKIAGLKKGDTVLDLCCGSGLSLKAIQSIIGSGGKIIAVDANDKMLALAKKRAEKNNWNNIQFIQSDIEKLELKGKIDFAFFALCWYDKKQNTAWTNKVSQLMDKKNGTLCFLDYKLPENGLRFIITPLIWILVKWLGEAYGLEDLKWNPKEEIGALLKDPKYVEYYFGCLFTISGKPKLSAAIN